MSDKNATHPVTPVEDPFLAALEAAEWDDEPYTDEERAASQQGWEEYLRGETVPWEVVRRELLADDDEGGR